METASARTVELALQEAGLTEHQAKLYKALATHGRLAASKAALTAGVPRTLAYKALRELTTLGLVTKEDLPGAVMRFTAAHPFKLKEIADRRLDQARDAKRTLDGVLSKLISEFTAVTNTPGVRILEGVAGVAELYEDELNEGQDLKLIRSPFDNDYPELDALVKRQVIEQVKAGIRARVITPMLPSVPKKLLASDAEHGVERRIIPRDEFMIPAQVVIYANKVAITAYEGPIMTTIIENPAIKTTFELIFDYLWRAATAGHEQIVSSLYK